MVQLVTTQAYSQRVIRAIQNSRTRVYVISLIIQQDNDPQAIITALASASERGVDVHVIGDYSTHVYMNGHLNPYYGYRQQVRNARELANRLRSHGVNFTWIGSKSPFLFAGRTHGKWIIADNTVFSFGGINLHASFTDDIDYQIEIQNAELADKLSSEHLSIIDKNYLDAVRLSCSFTTQYGQVLVDGGIPFDSMIYRHAIMLASTAQHILMVTQYCPTGKLAKLVSQTDHDVYFNDPTTSDLFTNLLIKAGKSLTGIHNSYTKQPYIHAKFMIVTHADGTKTAITGSHNFISYGGILGTREIALQTTNPDIIDQLELYYKKYIA
ncbi:MAG: phospholipase D-like domain-containing protein [Candidatus Saccharimonadales bacterium]